MLIKLNWNPNRVQLRNFGVLLLIVFTLAGGLFGWKFRAASIFYALAGIGAALGAACIFLPSVGLLVYKAWMGLGFCMGFIMLPLLLSLVFFLVFTPLGLFLRLFGRDAMQRHKPTGPSFWREIKHRTDKESYERQF